MTIQFETGKTYRTRDDQQFTIERRTAKTIWIEVDGETVARRITENDNGIECVKPYGNYSMALILAANRLVEPETVTEPVVQATDDEIEVEQEIEGDYDGTPVNDAVDHIVVCWHEGFAHIKDGAKFGSFESAHKAIVGIDSPLLYASDRYVKVKFQVFLRNGDVYEDRLCLSAVRPNEVSPNTACVFRDYCRKNNMEPTVIGLPTDIKIGSIVSSPYGDGVVIRSIGSYSTIKMAEEKTLTVKTDQLALLIPAQTKFYQLTEDQAGFVNPGTCPEYFDNNQNFLGDDNDLACLLTNQSEKMYAEGVPAYACYLVARLAGSNFFDFTFEVFKINTEHRLGITKASDVVTLFR